MKKIILFISLLLVFNSLPVYAYLDPGTGSVFVQGLLAGTAGIIAVLKIYWLRIKNFFKPASKKSIVNKSTSSNDSNNSA